ncbi:MAG: LamG-like jellyroll fold domain-containing protein [Patescibacteria group bacterium]|nr:LamG-like jellyroll fold domain-containing protein [Patescibacteria group bacterium]
MRSPIAVIVAVLTLGAAITADAASLVLYQNDFTTRGSLGLIGGATAYDYSLGNLVGAMNSTSGTQDGWIRRNGGTTPVAVADNGGNQYAQFAATTTFAYALQPIGSEINQGVIRVSVDVLAPTGWGGSSRTSLVLLGDNDFYAGLLESAGDLAFFNQVASVYGYRGTTNTEVKFSARNGDGVGGITYAMGTTPVTSSHWYRWIADLDLYTNTYSLDIYDLGAEQPTLSTATPKTPVQSYADLGFRRNLGNAAVDLNGITTVGIASFGNSSVVGFDNIVISDPRHEYVRHVADSNPAIYWQFADAVSIYDASNKAADTAMLLGGKNEAIGVHRSGIAWPTTNTAGIRGSAMASVKGSALAYDGLSSVAGVPVDDYSVQMWVKSTSEIALYKSGDTQGILNQSLNYFFARSHGDPANVSNSSASQQWQLPDNLSLSAYLVDSPRLSYVSWDLNGGAATAADDDGDGLGGRPLTTVTPIAHDAWYHVVFVREQSGYVSVYLNGKLEIFKYDPLDSGSYTYNGEYMVIGERANYGIFSSYGLNGLMDEVAVWGRALTAEEVRGLYHSVPEPGSFALLALIGSCLLPKRRRGRWSRAAGPVRR